MKTRNNNTWTEARFRAFVTSALRGASRKWGPINKVRQEARESRGKYRCARCKKLVPPTKDKKKNIFVDHIDPVVDPKTGFIDWNTYVDRLFCEKQNLQLLCRSCHDKKTKEERK